MATKLIIGVDTAGSVLTAAVPFESLRQIQNIW